MIAKRSHLFIFICIVFCGIGAYFLYIRGLVILAYEDQAPQWFSNIISNIYPRFFVEKKRFDLAFFLDKTDQIIIRFLFISFLTSTFLYIKSKSFFSNSSTRQLYSETTIITNVNVIRILYFIAILIIYYDIYWVLSDLSNAKAFFRPIALIKIFHLSFPSSIIIISVCILLLLSCLLGIFNIFPIACAISTVILSIYIQGVLFSFEKVDHGFAPITYAGMILPFLLYKTQYAKAQHLKEVNSWPLTLIQTLICLCYLFSGLEKVFISKLQWVNPETFKTYLLLHSTPLGLTISTNTLLCTLLPLGALLFQLGFISILFNKKLKYIFLPLGILFHIGSYFLFDIGGYLHPWLLTYFFFVDWNFKTK